MLGDIASAIVTDAVQTAGDIACGTVKARWGWRGCLSVMVLLTGAAMLLAWSLGAFSG